MINIMKYTGNRPKLAALAALALMTAGLAHGQTPAPLGATADEWTARSPAELEELIGPIALYPDDLIAIVLPASTYPLQIVQAARFSEDRESNPDLEPDADWDDSVVALLNYPEVLSLLNDDLDWTYELGEAVVYQQGDVLNAIQAFRDRAYAAGNLATDDRQVVATEDDGTITIEPADEEVVYVPYYDPARVVVHQHVPVYHYYPYAYPLYYYPYPFGYSFGPSLFWGVTTAFLISWHDHYLHVRHYSHFDHPYYGYSYYTPWYPRTSVYVNVNLVDNYYRWRPSYHHGGRPRHHLGYTRLRDDTVIRTPSERRIRSGWIRDGRDASPTQRPGGSVSTPTLDDRRARRIRSGRYTADDLRVDATRDRTSRDSIADDYRRPRGSGDARRAAVDAGGARWRNSRSETQPAARPAPMPRTELRGRSRGRAIGNIGTSPGMRVTPPRGASPAARGLQTSPPAGRSVQRAAPPAFGRVAPAQRAPAASRSGIASERPMSPPRMGGARPSGPATARGPAAAPRPRGGAHGQARQHGGRPGGAERNRRAR